MHQRPLAAQKAALGQQRHRRSAVMLPARGHLGRLLGDMDMSHRQAACGRQLRADVGNGLHIHRAQAVECNTQHRLPVQRIAAPQFAEVLQELPGGADERRLRRRGRGAAEITVLVQRRQQRQPDADPRRGARNRNIGIQWRVRAVPEPVQIKKLRHAGIAAAQQIQIAARRNGLQIVVADLRRCGVHRLAPAPEILARAARALRPGRQHALERVAVRIGNTR